MTVAARVEEKKLGTPQNKTSNWINMAIFGLQTGEHDLWIDVLVFEMGRKVSRRTNLGIVLNP